jgi:heme exporter protein CcmD
MNFELGLYSVYIWPAYGISAVLLIGVTLWTLAAWQRAKVRLAALEKRDTAP